MILVEWSPLDDAPPLHDVLADAPLPVRIVTVRREVAGSRFEHADEIALWIFAAKNVGIRRARAPFVLATNPDVLYSPALFRTITSNLEDGCFYRTSRFDVAGVPLEAPPRAQLRRCRRSIVRVNLVGGSVRFDEPSGGLTVLREIRRYEQTREEPSPDERADRPTDWLHTNASGDFFLMHRRRWNELQGYPEFASAGHLDSYMCVIAAAAGLDQTILAGRRRLYHLEHERAIDWEHEERATLHYVPYETFLEDARRMLEARRPTRFNDDGWGLAGLDLPETTIGRNLGYRRRR